MSVLKGVLLEEYRRLKKLEKQYKNKKSKYPKGSISKKKRKGQLYGYLAYREKGKVKFKYLGKISAKNVIKAEIQIKERKRYELLIKKVKNDLKEIGKAINGRKI